ncbi:MAG: Ribose import ATP-binding protein RbsA [Conexibacter sp.]|nr:Ribose import ATP-binding protein RbsA [Conexibacter sp.]
MSAADAPVLELTGLQKSYGATRALVDVSVSLGRGETIALVGENGAGKSTLAKIACGLVKPDEGTITVGGEAMSSYSALAAHAAGVRIVPQEVLLCPNLSVAENITLGGVPRKRGNVIDRRAMTEAAEQRLADLGIESLDVRRSAGRLSVVQKAVVQVARALIPGTRVMIVDEPTAPMSKAEVDELMRLLELVSDRGVGVLYVSHRLDEVLRLADRVVVLRDGHAVAELEAAGLTEPQLISAMAGGRDFTVHATREQRVTGEALAVTDLQGPTIDHLSFSVGWGEIVGFYGIASSGRDDLGALLTGVVEPEGGEVTVDGRSLTGVSVRNRIHHGIGYVPPERSAALLLGRSVRENISVAMLERLTERGLKKVQAERELASHWVQELSIKTASIEAPVRSLSGGSQQKVLLARWLAAGVRVLILEEPTRGVDIATKAEIYRLLREFADAGNAILIASSDIEDILAVADRSIVLRDGRIADTFQSTTDVESLRDSLLTAAIAEGVEHARV